MASSDPRGRDKLLLVMSALVSVCGIVLAVLPDQSAFGRVLGGLLGLAGLAQVVLYVLRLRRGIPAGKSNH